MHADLDRLEWAERDVSDQLSAGAGGQIESGLVAISCLLACKVRVKFLEKIIASIFESALGLYHVD